MNIFYFYHGKIICVLASMKKILLIVILALFFNYNPGAVEVENVIADKLRPGNVRLTNDNSTSESYEAAEKTIRAFMRKWCIEGASVAIAKEGRLLYARGFGYVDPVCFFTNSNTGNPVTVPSRV